jgi:hypothetical protein
LKKIISSSLIPECERFKDAYNYLIENKFIRNKTELADKLEGNPKKRQNIYDIFKYYRAPSREMLVKMDQLFGVDKCYLAFGEGELKKKSNNNTENTTPIKNEDSFMELLLKMYNNGEIFPAKVVKEKDEQIINLNKKLAVLEAQIESLKSVKADAPPGDNVGCADAEQSSVV